MGLSLYYATKDYKYDYETDTYIGNCDLSFNIGYMSYKIFKDKLLEFATNGMVNGDSLFINDIFKKSDKLPMFMNNEEQKSLLSYCWYSNDNGYKVVMTAQDFSNEEITSEKKEYLDKLEKIKQICPKLYNLYPFVFHSDCDGYICKEQLVGVLPILKECKMAEYLKEDYGKKFLDFLIETIEKVIKTDGKLMFG